MRMTREEVELTRRELTKKEHESLLSAMRSEGEPELTRGLHEGYTWSLGGRHLCASDGAFFLVEE